MLLRLLALFVVLPLVDLALLLHFSGGDSRRFFSAVALVVLTGLVGASLARQQGLAAWRRFQSELARGVPPGDAMLDGVLILLASAVLITPGLITDAIGLLLLVPQFRQVAKSRLTRRFNTRFQFQANHWPPPSNPPPHNDPNIIDAEFEHHHPHEDVESELE